MSIQPRTQLFKAEGGATLSVLQVVVMCEEVVSKDGISRPADKVGIEAYVSSAIPQVRTDIIL